MSYNRSFKLLLSLSTKIKELNQKEKMLHNHALWTIQFCLDLGKRGGGGGGVERDNAPAYAARSDRF